MRVALAAVVLAAALPTYAAEPAPDDWRLARLSRASLIAFNAHVTKLGMSGAYVEAMMISPDEPRPITLMAFETDCLSNKLRMKETVKLRAWSDTAGAHNRVGTEWKKPGNEFEVATYDLACKGTIADDWATFGNNGAGIVAFYYDKFLGMPEPTVKAQ